MSLRSRDGNSKRNYQTIKTTPKYLRKNSCTQDQKFKEKIYEVQ